MTTEVTTRLMPYEKYRLLKCAGCEIHRVHGLYECHFTRAAFGNMVEIEKLLTLCAACAFGNCNRWKTPYFSREGRLDKCDLMVQIRFS